MKIQYFLFLLIPVLSACFSEPDQPKVNNPTSGSVLVCNEGNFQWGNSSINLYQLDDGKFQPGDLFSSSNGRPLGDVLQSILKVDNTYWLVVNNSGKIEVVDKADFKSVKTLGNLGSPRHVCRISPDEVALSDLYSDSLSFFDIHSGNVTGKTFIKGWTEELCKIDDQLWVSNPNSKSIYEVTLADKKLKDSVTIGFGSFSVYADQNKHLWIATKGNKDLGIQSMIHCMDPKTKIISSSKVLGINPIQDFFVDEKDRVYYIYENQLYRFETNSPQSVPNLIYDGRGGNLYAVEYHAGRILLTDAIDYVQNGKVLVLNDSGKIIDEFNAGRIPNGFLFIP